MKKSRPYTKKRNITDEDVTEYLAKRDAKILKVVSDQPLLHASAYCDITEGIIAEDKPRTEKIMTIYLTKKEKKKLRKQRRQLRAKQRQE